MKDFELVDGYSHLIVGHTIFDPTFQQVIIQNGVLNGGYMFSVENKSNQGNFVQDTLLLNGEPIYGRDGYNLDWIAWREN